MANDLNKSQGLKDTIILFLKSKCVQFFDKNVLARRPVTDWAVLVASGLRYKPAISYQTT